MTAVIIAWAILAVVFLTIAAWLASVGSTLVALFFLVMAARCVAEALWEWDWR
jgi:hypothetical protein